MSTATQQVVSKAWNFAHVLRDDGLSYMAYIEQITFLLFLKMADEQTKPPFNRKPIVPAGFDWATLLGKEGDALENQYRHTLEKLSTQPGMLGEIFRKAKPEIQKPQTLRRLIVDLIEPEKWMSMQTDVKGDINEGLLAKSAAESPKGAGQYFTPRELIKAIVDWGRFPKSGGCARVSIESLLIRLYPSNPETIMEIHSQSKTGPLVPPLADLPAKLIRVWSRNDVASYSLAC